jgi:hypothetical protein
LAASSSFSSLMDDETDHTFWPRRASSTKCSSTSSSSSRPPTPSRLAQLSRTTVELVPPFLPFLLLLTFSLLAGLRQRPRSLLALCRSRKGVGGNRFRPQLRKGGNHVRNPLPGSFRFLVLALPLIFGQIGVLVAAPGLTILPFRTVHRIAHPQSSPRVPPRHVPHQGERLPHFRRDAACRSMCWACLAW